MELRRGTSPDTRNTAVSQWVTDLQTQGRTLLCVYALSFKEYPGSWRIGSDGGVLYVITSGVEGLAGAMNGPAEFPLR